VMVRSVGSRLSGHPRFVVCRRSVIERHWQKLTVFLPSANRSATFPGAIFAFWRRGTGVAIVTLCAPLGRGLTQRNLVSTLEQSPARGDTAATQELLETAPVSETDELTNGNRVPTGRCFIGVGCGCHTQRGVNSRGQGQADLPAQQPPSGAGAWVPAADAHARRPGDRVESAGQGSPQAICVIRRGI
jgi:hypothetical protein